MLAARCKHRVKFRLQTAYLHSTFTHIELALGALGMASGQALAGMGKNGENRTYRGRVMHS